MIFKYVGEYKDWDEHQQTFTFLSTQHNPNGNNFYQKVLIIAVGNNTGRIHQFYSNELERITKLEEILT